MGALATLFGLLVPVLLGGPGNPGLIQTIEDLFRSKPKSGPTDKMPALEQSIRAIITQMIASGATLPDGSKPVQPTDEQLLAFLEGQVQVWKNPITADPPVTHPPGTNPATAVSMANPVLGNVLVALGKGFGGL